MWTAVVEVCFPIDIHIDIHFILSLMLVFCGPYISIPNIFYLIFPGRGDVNVSLGDDNRRRDYLEEENKKLLYQINLLLSKKDGGDDMRDIGGRTSDSSDDITRLRRKLAIAEEDRDKFERLKKDIEYEMDRYKSKCETLQTEVER